MRHHLNADDWVTLTALCVDLIKNTAGITDPEALNLIANVSLLETKCRENGVAETVLGLL